MWAPLRSLTGTSLDSSSRTALETISPIAATQCAENTLQFARRMQESGDYGFTGSAEFYALVTGGFQRVADAQLGHPYAVEDQNKLLRSLAALKEELGLPD